jgi:hypothetical protein
VPGTEGGDPSRLLQFSTKPVAYRRFPWEIESAATHQALTARSLLVRKPVRQRATAGAMDGM